MPVNNADVDEFFTAGDPNFAERLNNPNILFDIFTVKPKITLPGAFKAGIYPSNENKTKAVFSIVQILNNTCTNTGDGFTATANDQSFTLRVYPNFSSFKWWNSIIWEGTGTIACKMKDSETGTELIEDIASGANLNSYNIEHKPVDIIFTLQNGARVTNITFEYQNQPKLTGSEWSLPKDNITGLNDELNNKANQSDVTAISNTLDTKANQSDINNINSALNTKANQSDVNNINTVLANKASQSAVDALFDMLYPVGVIVEFDRNKNPNSISGWKGTWTQIKDKFTLSAGDIYSVGQTGGSATHTLTESQMPAHKHDVAVPSSGQSTTPSGGGGITGSSGAHIHPINFTKDGVSSGVAVRVTSIPPADSKSNDITDSAGEHTHSTPSHAHTMPNHAHAVSESNKGSGQAHNNMPPYVVVYKWVRTA